MARKVIVGVVAAALAVVPAEMALGKGPARGKYTCTAENVYPNHVLTIKKKHKYRYKTNSSYTTGGGKFKVKGKTIKFKTGPLHKYPTVGKIGKTADGKPQIRLHQKGRPPETDEICVKG